MKKMGYIIGLIIGIPIFIFVLNFFFSKGSNKVQNMKQLVELMEICLSYHDISKALRSKANNETGYNGIAGFVTKILTGTFADKCENGLAAETILKAQRFT